MFKHTPSIYIGGGIMPPRKQITPISVESRVHQVASRVEPLPVDVEDRGEEFLVSADLPGLRKQNIDINVQKDGLQIVADFGDDGEGTYHRKERGRGEVRRVIQVPEPIDEKHVSASYNDGILWITLKKRHQPKRVEIE